MVIFYGKKIDILFIYLFYIGFGIFEKDIWWNRNIDWILKFLFKYDLKCVIR